MKLFYYKDPIGNFGDDINAWIWRELAPGIWDEADDITVSGIGTILGKYMPPSPQWVVMGSGAGYAAKPRNMEKGSWNILCVRGPLTASVLGIAEEKAITDGAILISLFAQYQPVPAAERKGIVFMPHHQKARRFGRWKEACERAGIEYLDPCADSKQLLERIRHAELVLADAMHAAIVADTVRVPWIPVAISSETNSFKWLDWTLSMELPYTPVTLRMSSLLESWYDKINAAFGENFSFADLSEKGAREYFQNSSNFSETVSAKIIRRGSGYCLRMSTKLLNAVARCLQLPFIEGIYRRHDDRLLAAAADSLLRASKEQPFLSRADIFIQRKNQMKACLATLSALGKPGDSKQGATAEQMQNTGAFLPTAA